ncbi:MAG: hypothetical protein J6I31_08785 [Prevotella sp.]|nr:hypothetical protein [Prevotella sp.]
MGQHILYSVHRNPQKDGDGNETYHIRHETRGTLGLRFLQDHLQKHQRIQPEVLQSACMLIAEQLVEQLTNNHRLQIEGIGTFYLKLGFAEKTDENGNTHTPKFTDPMDITANDICVDTIGFTPDKELVEKLRNKPYTFEKFYIRGFVGHSNIYTEEEVRAKLEAYLENHMYISRKGFMGLFGFTGYMADKWLGKFTTEPAPMLRRFKVGTTAVYYPTKKK